MCEATAELVVRETEEPGPDTFRAVVTYGAAYALIEGPDFEDADFEAFAQIVGAFNLHPYLRECLHSTMARCGLPPLVLPPLKSPLPTEDARAAIDASHFEEECPASLDRYTLSTQKAIASSVSVIGPSDVAASDTSRALLAQPGTQASSNSQRNARPTHQLAGMLSARR